MIVDRRSWGMLCGRASHRQARHPAIGRSAPSAGTPASLPVRFVISPLIATAVTIGIEPMLENADQLLPMSPD